MRTSKPQTWVVAALAALLTVGPLPDASAISRIVPGGVTLEKPEGGPVAETTIDIVFAGQPAKGKTDDRGFLPLLLMDGPEPKIDVTDGRVTLTGDGRGMLMYGGPPATKVPFEVKEGTLILIQGQGGPFGMGNTGYAIAGGGAALLLITGLAVVGGGGNDTITPGDVPSNTPGGNTGGGTTTPTSTTTNVNYIWNVNNDPRNSAQFVQLQNSRQGAITVNGTTFTITGQPPFVTLQGTVTAGGQVTANGAGPLAGRPSVGVRLVGTLTGARVLNGTVFVGEDGALGGQLPHIVEYGVIANPQ